MLVGAVTSFIVAATTKNPWLGVVAGILAGVALSLVFAVLTLSLMANQVATGLALSLFGVGLSAFVGLNYVSIVIEGIKPLAIAGAVRPSVHRQAAVRSQSARLPVARAVRRDPVVPLSDAAGTHRPCRRRKPAVGARDRLPGRAHPLSRGDVRRCVRRDWAARTSRVAYTPMWTEGMTAGRGWIALALVVFATWRPWRVLAGAYLFGGVTLATFQAQALGGDACRRSCCRCCPISRPSSCSRSSPATRSPSASTRRRRSASRFIPA